MVALALAAVVVSWNDFYLLRLKTYSIPSSNMRPTLEVGEVVLATKIFPSMGEHYEPVRGDVIVFTIAAKRANDFLKRVIGLPGERIRLQDGVVLINDVPVPRQALADYRYEDPDGSENSAPRFRETLPNGRSYEVLDLDPQGEMDTTREYVVPDGHLFVMGDNRDNSVDSRYTDYIGYVPLSGVSAVVETILLRKGESSSLWQPVQPEAN
ncbi:prokaryotic type I signal peptidase [Stappia aggregata IAM 12614]|uniref:Signal peptidase I n=1 Tax=Roseibium aggregatum (strain ATCC 25650 / DSM 13394 / JCM 20685 / NBRC 16684 / NCIMB 2208 / IAM 12614 / B1) TaxID=384765 RepID=A0NMB6_ROSAI|nr:prokaryotic type I signal peptidase [Stappia aggregata IAM 12614] [Roseibium aggregatum IAM 12614]